MPDRDGRGPLVRDRPPNPRHHLGRIRPRRRRHARTAPRRLGAFGMNAASFATADLTFLAIKHITDGIAAALTQTNASANALTISTCTDPPRASPAPCRQLRRRRDLHGSERHERRLRSLLREPRDERARRVPAGRHLRPTSDGFDRRFACRHDRLRSSSNARETTVGESRAPDWRAHGRRPRARVRTRATHTDNR